MKSGSGTSRELLEEISVLKRKIKELEEAEAGRRRSEEALKEAGDSLTACLENAPDGVYMMDMEGNFLYGNRRSEEIIGYSRDELIGSSFLRGNLLSEASFFKAAELFQASMEGKPTGPDEIELVSKEGLFVPVEINTSVIQYMGRTVVIGFVRDITNRKRAAQEILLEKEKLKTLLDNAPFGMLLIGREDRVVYMNTHFTDLFGYDMADIPDLGAWYRKAYPDAGYRNAVVEAAKEDLGGADPGARRSRVFTVTCKDGTEKVVSLVVSVLASGDYLMSCEDITEMRRLESQLRHAQKMESIGTLAGGIAHDFNNILSALMGYASLMQMKMEKDSSLRPYLDQILSASRKAADLTQSLLAFSRKQPVTLLPLDVNSTIGSTKKLLKRLLTEDISLHTTLTGDDTVVMADRSQVDQILFNLVTNARDAMPRGGTLAIGTDIADIDDKFTRAHGFGRPGRYVMITISDTGEGMDEVTQRKIFDPFFTTKETGKGTGLGLATVYGIVKQHEGYITVQSEPGRGSTFRIYLPAVQAQTDHEQETPVPVIRGTGTILIAEDNEEVRRFMREALREYGYRTIEAADGEDAVSKFGEHGDVDLVIVDSVMPKKNGREVCEEVRRMDPRVRVLFTSGYTKDVILEKGMEDGGLDFIAKPLTLDRLLRKVRELLTGQTV
jgi:PAS domain S-box-containing protein